MIYHTTLKLKQVYKAFSAEEHKDDFAFSHDKEYVKIIHPDVYKIQFPLPYYHKIIFLIVYNATIPKSHNFFIFLK